MNITLTMMQMTIITMMKKKDKHFADFLKNKTLKLLENKKFYEYYNYKNSECLGANNFSWSAALYLDLKLSN